MAAATALRFSIFEQWMVELTMARNSAAKVLGLCSTKLVLAAKAQQGCLSQISLVNRWMKPMPSNTARWLKGSATMKPSMLSARRLATMSGGAITRSCTSVSGSSPFSAR